MKTYFILFALLFATVCCSQTTIYGNNETLNDETFVTEEVSRRDTFPNFIIADTIYDENYVVMTCKSLQIDTSAKLSVCPILIIDGSEGNALFVLVSSNRKDMLKIKTCNIIVDGKQYPTHFESTVLEKNHVEAYLFSTVGVSLETVANSNEIKFALWGDFGSVSLTLSERQAEEFRTLIEYYN